jgi:hypothetical protein
MASTEPGLGAMLVTRDITPVGCDTSNATEQVRNFGHPIAPLLVL